MSISPLDFGGYLGRPDSELRGQVLHVSTSIRSPVLLMLKRRTWPPCSLQYFPSYQMLNKISRPFLSLLTDAHGTDGITQQNGFRSIILSIKQILCNLLTSAAYHPIASPVDKNPDNRT